LEYQHELDAEHSAHQHGDLYRCQSHDADVFPINNQYRHQFNAGAAAYTLGVAGVTNSGVNYTLNVNGTGIINNSSNTQSFTVTSALTSSAALNFNNSSTAGNSHLSVNTGGFSTSSASINFNNTSSAGNATMQVFDGGFNLGFVFFNDSSTAANASIQLLGMGKVQFNGQSTAGNATELWAKVGDGVKG
jgi:hypothetical protein